MRAVHGTDGADALKKQHDEIRDLFSQISRKLDSLSHFHFTPKPVVIEASIKTNKIEPEKALTVEDATPVSVSDASLVAPQEIFTPHARALTSKDEMSTQEKRAQRRHRKDVTAKQKQEEKM